MHCCLYLCLPQSDARTSAQARRQAVDYLAAEGFASETRFGGACDYFSVGGRWSGRLELLRLKHAGPKLFREFWQKYVDTTTDAQGLRLFKRMYPQYKKTPPVGRSKVPFEGAADDAQVVDAVLYKQLEKGFAEELTHTWEPHKPNVLFTDRSGEEACPAEEIVDKYWVVVIDYHA